MSAKFDEADFPVGDDGLVEYRIADDPYKLQRASLAAVRQLARFGGVWLGTPEDLALLYPSQADRDHNEAAAAERGVVAPAPVVESEPAKPDAAQVAALVADKVTAETLGDSLPAAAADDESGEETSDDASDEPAADDAPTAGSRADEPVVETSAPVEPTPTPAETPDEAPQLTIPDEADAAPVSPDAADAIGSSDNKGDI